MLLPLRVFSHLCTEIAVSANVFSPSYERLLNPTFIRPYDYLPPEVWETYFPAQYPSLTHREYYGGGDSVLVHFNDNRFGDLFWIGTETETWFYIMGREDLAITSPELPFTSTEDAYWCTLNEGKVPVEDVWW